MFKSNRNRRQTLKHTQAVEACEARLMLSAANPTFDGSGNNLDHPHWGSVDSELLRMTSVEYADGIDQPSGENRPSARLVSNNLATQTTTETNDRNLTDYLWLWGQFIDHDISLSESADPEEAFNIEVPKGDFLFDPFETGEALIGLNRTVYATSEDSGSGSVVRQQVNQITAFIDAGSVYGSSQDQADSLRTFEGGRMKTSDGNLLPFDKEVSHHGGRSFVSGDVRANENVGLTSMHTLFVREHNRLAEELAEQNPDLTDEQLYQEARSLVAAQLQVITYNEFLPAVLGPGAISEYTGYDASVNPSVTNEFSTAAFRFGHSLLSPEIQRLNENGDVIAAGNLSLKGAFFNSEEVVRHGVDAILRGAATQAAQELDNQVIDEVQNFLFGHPGSGGFDLAALNIQRGRDHGLADYNQIREDLGRGRVTSFDQISSNPAVARALKETYQSVDEIDLWAGGLAEDHVEGSSIGATFSAILVDQFERLRDGDSFWYQNRFSGEQLQQLESTTLSSIIERNSTVTGLQENVFFMSGTEELFVDLQREQADNVVVRAVGDRVEVVDADSGRVIVSRPTDEVVSVNLRGQDGVSERFTADSTIAELSDRMSVTVTGGSHGRDVLAVSGTHGDDRMTVVDQTISFENLDLVFSEVEMLCLEGGDGDDQLDASGAHVETIILDGGAGHDTLLGSQGHDRMFGRDGRDVLRGGGGDDQMSGGDGTDRVYGDVGEDQINGGAGNDLLVQEGQETTSAAAFRLACFMQDSLGIRTTDSLFENWGGLGEKWMYSSVGWLFLTPNGELYQWDGQQGASGKVLAELGAKQFDDIQALVSPHVGHLDDDAAWRIEAVGAAVGSQLGLRSTGDFFENWAGLNERWLWGTHGWYFIMPDGMLYEYDGNVAGVPGTPVADVDLLAYQNPELLTGLR